MAKGFNRGKFVKEKKKPQIKTGKRFDKKFVLKINKNDSVIYHTRLNSSSNSWWDLLFFFSSLEKNEDSDNNADRKTFSSSSSRFYFMHEKKYVKEAASPDAANFLDDLLNYIDKNPSHTIGFNLHNLSYKNHYIILDIDDQNIGTWILSLMQHQPGLFEKVFKTPLVIHSETPGHLHLYYKSDQKILSQDDWLRNKVKHCTRLGFPAEYSFGNIALASQKRFIVQAPVNLNNISLLPPNLYPYNYYPAKDFFSLVQGIPFNPNQFPNAKFITEGRRNTSLYYFFKYDNFTKDHVLAANALLCDPPIAEEDELTHSCVNWRFKDNKIDSQEPSNKFFSCELFSDKKKEEFYRLRIDDDYPKHNYDSIQKIKCFSLETITLLKLYNFNPDWILQAKYQQTEKEALTLVAYLEKQANLFFKDSEWIGKKSESVLLNYFLVYHNYQRFIKYIAQEQNWYLWQKTHWVLSSVAEVDNLLFTFLTEKVSFAGLEFSFFKTNNAIWTVIWNYVQLDNWPSNQCRGINFENGILLAEEDKRKSYLAAHNPEFFHRYCLPCDYIENATLTPIQARFICDICTENHWNINLFRYLFFLILCPRAAQVGLFLTSKAGGSKSTLIRFIEKLFANGVVSLSVQDIKQGNSFANDYSSGSQVRVIHDVSPQSINNSAFTDYVKQFIGRDKTSAQKKHKNFYQSSSEGFFILVSNFNLSEIPLFSEYAVYDRLLSFSTPVIKNGFKLTNLEDFLMTNLSGFINWILHSSMDYLNRFIRVGDLNKLYLSDNQLSLMFQFVKEYLIYVPNRPNKPSAMLPWSDVIEKFRKFAENHNPKQVNNYSDKTITKELEEIINSLIPSQKATIKKGWRTKFWGYECLAFRKRFLNELEKPLESRKYFDAEQLAYSEPLKFEENEAIQNLLNKDPFAFDGIVTTTKNSYQLIKINQAFPELEKESYQLISCVLPYTCADLVRHSKGSLEPFNSSTSELLKLDTPILANSCYESALSVDDYAKGHSICSSSYYEKTGLSVPLWQLAPSSSKIPLSLGSSSNPHDYVMQQITHIELIFAQKSAVNGEISFFDEKINDLSAESEILYNKDSLPLQIQKILLKFIVNLVLEKTNQFPTHKHIFYLFYSCFSDILNSEELLFAKLKPSEVIYYLQETYSNYSKDLNNWNHPEFENLVNKLEDADFFCNFKAKQWIDLFNEGFIPLSEAKTSNAVVEAKTSNAGVEAKTFNAVVNLDQAQDEILQKKQDFNSWEVLSTPIVEDHKALPATPKKKGRPSKKKK